MGGQVLPEPLQRKIFTREAAIDEFGPERADRLVFTNGVFDLLHRGHVELLLAARASGDRLVVGLNDDASARRLKGPGRPIVPEADRAACLAALESVDGIVSFHEDTPEELIAAIQPDVLVKGGDYEAEEVVGRETLEARGGRVVIVPLTPGRSTSVLLEQAARLYSD